MSIAEGFFKPEWRQAIATPPPPPPAHPDNTEAAAERAAAAEEERKRTRGGKGFFSTNPTGAQGLLAPANVASKSLLGL